MGLILILQIRQNLQKVIDSHLMISVDEGRFRIMVGKEGMLWTAKKAGEYSYDYEKNLLEASLM